MTWLLVEDDNDIRNVVAVMMSVWGERPLSFADGTAAWTWLDSVVNGTFSGELPDLALMDIRMPGYTGDKVAARIRQIPALKDIPIILMTAFSLSDAEVRTMMEEAGIDHLINKPLPDMEVFRTTLYRVRDERRAQLANRRKVSAPPAPAQPTTQPPAQPSPAAQAAADTAPVPAQPSEAKPAQPPVPQGPAQSAPPAPAQPTTQPPAQPSPAASPLTPATPQTPTPAAPPQAPAQATEQKPAQPTTTTQPVKSPSEKESR